MDMNQTANATRLRCHLNLMSLEGQPGRGDKPLESTFEEIRSAGYDGVQFHVLATPEMLRHARSLGLGSTSLGRVNQPEEAFELASRLSGEGHEAATLHLGWGLEDDEEGSRLIEAVLQASDRYKIPLYPETHRATLFQDMWRTVQFVKRFPELRFNGDFSHWYTGQEMVYGGFESKRSFLKPFLERVRFIHARIGNPGSIQVSIAHGSKPAPEFIGHFQLLWQDAMRGYLVDAASAPYLYFVPELLSPRIFYGREVDCNGVIREEADRWEESLLLCDLGREAFRLAGQAHAAEHDR
jgi:hypothetical protein